MPRGDGVRVPNPPGPRRKRKQTEVPQYIPRKLATRLLADIWAKGNRTYEDPKGQPAQEMRRPGSQNPRK